MYRRASVTFKGTKTEARLELARLNGEVRPRTVRRTNATFEELFKAWLASADLAMTTVQAHRMLYNRHIGPALGPVRLRDLGTDLLEELYGHLHKDKPAGAGLSASSIRRLHSVIDSALKRAVAWEWIERNPAEWAKPPRIHGRPVTYTPTELEMKRAIDVAATISRTAFAFIWCAAATGMRRGELCGLQWTDIDGPGHMIYIRRNVVDAGGHLDVKAPKSGKGRIVQISDELIAVLFHYQLEMNDRSVWVWSNEAGERVRPERLTKMWNHVREAAGIPTVCRLHDLRHGYASSGLAAGGEGSLAAISAQIGHADPTTTSRHYISPQTRDQQMVADRMGRMLAGTDEP